MALLEDGTGDGWAQRRKNAPPHLIMSHDLEKTSGAVFPKGQRLNRHVAGSIDEAMRIMRERGVYKPRR